ncbi:MAG: hypothetical protein WB564_05035 [Dehalococcoidia bacterium]
MKFLIIRAAVVGKKAMTTASTMVNIPMSQRSFSKLFFILKFLHLILVGIAQSTSHCTGAFSNIHPSSQPLPSCHYKATFFSIIARHAPFLSLRGAAGGVAIYGDWEARINLATTLVGQSRVEAHLYWVSWEAG